VTAIKKLKGFSLSPYRVHTWRTG